MAQRKPIQDGAENKKKYEHYGQHEKMLTIGEHRWASLTRNLTS